MWMDVYSIKIQTIRVGEKIRHNYMYLQETHFNINMQTLITGSLEYLH